MKVTLKDGSVLNAEKNTTAEQIAMSISEGLARNALAAKIDGEIVDLRTVINKDCVLEILTARDKETREIFLHTAAHVLAQAVKNLYPTTQLAIGPAIKDGFYYDFDFSVPITPSDFEKIEKEMKAIIKADFPMERIVVSREQALTKMRGFGEQYKIQIIEDLPADAKITLY